MTRISGSPITEFFNNRVLGEDENSLDFLEKNQEFASSGITKEVMNKILKEKSVSEMKEMIANRKEGIRNYLSESEAGLSEEQKKVNPYVLYKALRMELMRGKKRIRKEPGVQLEIGDGTQGFKTRVGEIIA